MMCYRLVLLLLFFALPGCDVSPREEAERIQALLGPEPTRAIADIGAFEAGLLKEVSPALLETIRTEKVISDSTDAKLKELCEGYTKGFIAAKA